MHHYTKPNLKYWILTVSMRLDKTHSFGTTGMDVASDDKATETLFESYALQGSKFRPGDALQHVARINGGRGKEQSWAFGIVNLVETTREDLEAYCLDFDKGKTLIDLDSRTTAKVHLTQAEL